MKRHMKQMIIALSRLKKRKCVERSVATLLLRGGKETFPALMVPGKD
jgi:hypothetical protein